MTRICPLTRQLFRWIRLPLELCIRIAHMKHWQETRDKFKIVCIQLLDVMHFCERCEGGIMIDRLYSVHFNCPLEFRFFEHGHVEYRNVIDGLQTTGGWMRLKHGRRRR